MLLFTWLIHLCWAEPDSSENTEQAKEFFLNGQQLYDESRYKAAIIAWEEGYEITKLPAFLKNIALAYEGMGDYSKALETLSIYRAYAPNEEQDALREWQETLEAELATQEAELQEKEAEAAAKAEHTTIVETDTYAENQNTPAETTVAPPTETDFTWKPMWTAGSAATIGLAATALTIQASRLQSNLLSSCEAAGESWLCAESAQPLQTSLDSTQTNALILWGATAAVSGLALWQLTNQQVQLTPNSITLQGRF